MKVNDIIVLENKERYTLIEETAYESSRYFLAAAIDKEENINAKKLVLLKLVEQEDGSYVEIIQDEDLIIKLSAKIKEEMK